MSDSDLHKTIQNQDEQIRRLRLELQQKTTNNYEQKYKKALRSIEEIIRANKQIQQQLDNLRLMRQTDLDAFANAQKQQFKRAYDLLLKDKNNYVLNLQTLQLENQKLKFTLAELQSQINNNNQPESLKQQDKRNTPTNDKHSPDSSPLKPASRDPNQILRQKQAEFHRTIANYEQHHSNLTRNNKRLEERITELETKLHNTEKTWRTKFQTKELEVIDIKALTRQEFTEQISTLRKENSSLKLANNDLQLKIQSLERSTANNSKKGTENYDWQADLVQEMIAVKANLEPLRQQIGELQQMNFYEKEQSVRERTNLQTHVLELQAEVERQNESIKNLERKIMELHQERAGLEEKAQRLKTVEEENKLLNGRVIVMQSREIALKNRTGEELEERILQFQSRVELLLSNKEGLKELREVGIHQLLALKAYILQLDSKLKQLLSSNNHLLRKYKSYKERYQAALKQEKTYGMTVNTLKMKILGYDKLVLKLQGELQSIVKINQQEILQAARKPEEDGKAELYRKKYELTKEKLEVQQKYKQQQIQTLKLNYDARIMELTIKLEDMKSLKETIELYRHKNQQLQTLLSRRQNQLYQSKLTHSKAPVVEQTERSVNNNRHTKDIINSLHLTIKTNDQTIFKLQSELRTKEDNYKRTITKLQREIIQLQEDHQRANSRNQIDYNLSLDHEIKKNKAKVLDLQQRLRSLQISHKEEQAKVVADLQAKLHKLQTKLQEADAQREEQVFSRRRLQKQILELTHDVQELQTVNSELQLKLSQLRLLQRQNEQLRVKLHESSKQSMRDSYVEYELQGKESIITKLKNEIIQLRSASGSVGEKDLTISSLRNQITYLTKDNQSLHQNINKYINQITLLKGNLDSDKNNYSTGMQDIIRDKDQLIAQLRRDLNTKDTNINQFEDEISNLQENIRKLRRDLTEMDSLREELQRLQTVLTDKSSLESRLRQDNANYDEEIERLKRELSFVKQGFQKQTYELLQSKDEVSKLQLEINSITLRNKEQQETKFNQQIQEKDRIISKLNADLQTAKNTLRTIEEDRDYHQETVKRNNSDIANFRAQISELDQENTQLRDQLYSKTQELNKLQFAAEGYRSQLQDYEIKQQETIKIRNELFAARNQISVLQDQVYAKESATARINKELTYLKNRENQLQEELRAQRQANSSLAYQIGSLRNGDEQTQTALQERDNVISKLNNDLASAKNKYRQLQEEMEEREQAFGLFTQQLNKLKGTLSYYEDDLQSKDTQIDRLNRERQTLRDQIEQLGQEITHKNLQVGRAKQQTFAVRMQASEREYQDKMRFDQELFTYKSKITLLEQTIEDKDGQVRRTLIELETVRNKEPTTPRVDQGELQDLRAQLSKKQRELINFKFELEDRQYQLDSANSNIGLLKATITDYQTQLEEDRQKHDSELRNRTQRERKLQQQISMLKEELQRKPLYTEPSTISYSITYTEQEMAAVNEQLSIKQRQLNSMRYELQDKCYLIQNLQSKIRIQQKLIGQLEEQREQESSRRSSQLHQFIKSEKHYRELDIQQSKFQFKQQLPEEEVLSQSVQPDLEGNRVYPVSFNTNLVTINNPALVDTHASDRPLQQQIANPISEVQEQLETSQGFISYRRQEPQPSLQQVSVPQISTDQHVEPSEESKDSFIKQLQKDKLTESQLGKITIKIQHNPQLATHHPQLAPNAYPPPLNTFIPPPYPLFQNQPQYTRLPQSQSQVGRQTRLQQQQFVRYSQQVPFQSSPISSIQTIVRAPIIGIPPPAGQFRSI